MAKLQKHTAWKRGKDTYYKWVITLPSEEIIKAGFEEGDSMKVECIKPGVILLRAIKAQDFVEGKQIHQTDIKKKYYDKKGTELTGKELVKAKKQEEELYQDLIQILDKIGAFEDLEKK